MTLCNLSIVKETLNIEYYKGEISYTISVKFVVRTSIYICNSPLK